MAPDIITLHALSKDRNTTETDLTDFVLEITQNEVSQVLFRLSRWENLDHA